jgi:hypothetical protein
MRIRVTLQHPEAKLGEILGRVVAVDRELDEKAVTKTVLIQEGQVVLQLEGKDPKKLRTSVRGLFEQLKLAA